MFCFIGRPRDGSERSTVLELRRHHDSRNRTVGTARSPYPSSITVAGLTGTVAKVTVTLSRSVHTFPDDVDVLLVGPTGAKFILMSDATGAHRLRPARPTHSTIGATALLPDGSAPPPRARTGRPTTARGDTFPAPAPAGPYLTPAPAGTDSLTSAFTGLNPNGTWSLYVVDDAGGDVGTFAGGWELKIITPAPRPGGVTSDFNGDCASDIAVFRPSTGQWFVRNQAPVQFGLPGDIPVAGDYNGDGTTDRAVYRPSTGEWFVQSQATVQWGLPGDIPVPGDYNGDGTTDRAVYPPVHRHVVRAQPGDGAVGAARRHPRARRLQRRSATDIARVSPVHRPVVRARPERACSSGCPATSPCPATTTATGRPTRAVYRPSTGTMVRARVRPRCSWGCPATSPCPATTTATGRTDRAVYRPSTGQWFIQGQAAVQWGLAGDVPVPRPDAVGDFNGDGTPDVGGYLGDFDGNGTTDVAVYRPTTGQWFAQDQAAVQWGLPGDIPVPGDYDGNGTTERAVYRPSTGTGSCRGQADGAAVGLPGDIPVPGDYDGNGTMDIAVYPSVDRRSGSSRARPPVQLGLPGDVPVPGDYDGNGTTESRVYRPSTGQWFVQDQGHGAVGAARRHPGAGRLRRQRDHGSRGVSAVERPLVRAEPGAGAVGTPGDIAGAGRFQRRRRDGPRGLSPVDGQWFVQNQFTVQWGLAGDFPASRAYSPKWL